MAAIRVWIDRTTGKINHHDPETDITTEIGSITEGLTAAEIKQRMIDMGLRLR